MNLSQTINRIHRGFTLVELLFVIAIIAVLSTMALGVMKSAQDDAKEAATRSRITQIEAILQIELEDYEVRQLPIRLNALAAYVRANPVYTDGGGNPIKVGTQVRNLRRRILADIISAEFPRPLLSGGNFLLNPDLGVFPTTIAGAGNPQGFRDWLDNTAYPNPPSGLPRLSNLLANLSPARVKAWRQIAALSNKENFNLPGEYLYAVLTRIDLDGSPAIESLGNNAIGDFDSDGFLEVVDAWGEPMQLRIWQVDAQEVDDTGSPSAGTDIWEDVPGVNFDLRAGATEYRDDVGNIQKNPGIPSGYTVLDPTVPREVNKIRFEVTATRLIQ